MAQVICITAGITAATWLAVVAVMLPMARYLSSMAHLSTAQILAFCSLCATLMVARSPASAIAVLQETGGKGAFCSLVLAVVIVKDVVTIVAFSLNIELSRSMLASGRGSFSLYTLVEPFASLVVAATLGALGSWVVTGVVHRLEPVVHKRAWAVHVRHAALVVLSTCIFEVAAYLRAEPLLACAVTGLLSTNMLCAAAACAACSACITPSCHVRTGTRPSLPMWTACCSDCSGRVLAVQSTR